jgi:hypothetical protein
MCPTSQTQSSNPKLTYDILPGSSGLNMDGDRLYTDAQLLYFNADLTSQILPYLDMPSLMALAQVDRAGRVMAQEEFRARLKWLLRAFIPEDSFDAFFNMMKRTGTVIVGGISYYLGEFNLPTHPPVPKPMWQWWHVDTATYDMNLLVPLDSWQDAIDWFLDLDCEEFRVEVIAPAFRDSVFSFVSTSFSSGGGCRVSSLTHIPCPARINRCSLVFTEGLCQCSVEFARTITLFPSVQSIH